VQAVDISIPAFRVSFNVASLRRLKLERPGRERADVLYLDAPLLDALGACGSGSGSYVYIPVAVAREIVGGVLGAASKRCGVYREVCAAVCVCVVCVFCSLVPPRPRLNRRFVRELPLGIGYMFFMNIEGAVELVVAEPKTQTLHVFAEAGRTAVPDPVTLRDRVIRYSRVC
jgi:hypothetical protein